MRSLAAPCSLESTPDPEDRDEYPPGNVRVMEWESLRSYQNLKIKKL
jgi:hypothetical protein